MVGPRHMIDRLVEWGEARADVRALLVIGSMARVTMPADRWSDLDVVLVTTDPRRYLDDGAWLHAIGKPWLSFVEPTATGGRTERRALFDDAVDVDFIVMAADEFRHIVAGGRSRDVDDVLSRGFRFILDKDDVSVTIGAVTRPAPVKPTQAAFDNVVGDFWYHTVWVGKKLLRGDVWMAHGGTTYLQRNALLPMVTWHAKALNGWAYETWYGGRFLETWADPQIVSELRSVAARQEPHDIERALDVAMRLFSRVAPETAEHLGYAYPREAETNVTDWLRRALHV